MNLWINIVILGVAIAVAFIFAWTLSRIIAKRKVQKQANIEKKKRLGISDI